MLSDDLAAENKSNKITAKVLSSSFITPEGSKIIQIKHLKHKITQQCTSKDDKKHHYQRIGLFSMCVLHGFAVTFFLCRCPREERGCRSLSATLLTSM